MRQISGYPEYTSTALGSFFHVPANKIPSHAVQAYNEAKADLAKEGIVAYPPTPFADSNAVGTLTTTAQKLGLKNISDLTGKSQDLVLDGSPECRVRSDCLVGLETNYGLRFKQFKPVAIGRRYAVLDHGEASLSILFTSDAQLASSTKYTILNDDKGLIPPGNVIFLASKTGRGPGGAGFRRDDREGSKQPDAPGHPGAEFPGRHRQAGSGGSRPSIPEVVGLRPVMRDPKTSEAKAAANTAAGGGAKPQRRCSNGPLECPASQDRDLGVACVRDRRVHDRRRGRDEDA